MKLKFEEDLKVAVEVDGKPFITMEEGMLYEQVEKDSAYLYIKTEDEKKQIKIRIEKK